LTKILIAHLHLIFFVKDIWRIL